MVGSNILILDKDEEIKKLLIEEGINAESAKNSDEFFEKLKKGCDVAIINPNTYKKDIKELMQNLANRNIGCLIILDKFDEVEKTVDALSAGAIDYFLKPILNLQSKDDIKNTIEDIKVKIEVANKAKYKITIAEITKEIDIIDYDFKASTRKIVIIGSSTGGPQSLEQVIPILPKNIPAPVIVVQHMPPVFTKKFAERLNDISDIKVKEAEDDEEIKEGVCYIAKGDYHLELKKNKNNKTTISLSQKERLLGVRPCINITMESASKLYGKNSVGVILTGMGSDGTVGAKKIKEAGGTVIVESERTSIIPSMPRSVVNSGYCDEVVDIDKIGVAILQLLEV